MTEADASIQRMLDPEVELYERTEALYALSRDEQDPHRCYRELEKLILKKDEPEPLRTAALIVVFHKYQPHARIRLLLHQLIATTDNPMQLRLVAVEYYVESYPEHKHAVPLVAFLLQALNEDPTYRGRLLESLAVLAQRHPNALRLLELTLAGDDHPTPRAYALYGLAELRGIEGTNLKLLTKNFKGNFPALDPQAPITPEQVTHAAEALQLTPAEVEVRYEYLAQHLPLTLEWR